jgi:hypothetical protein
MRAKQAAILTLFALAVRPLVAADDFKATLSMVPIDISMRSTIKGTGHAQAVLSGSTLTITGTFDGLASPATSADVHLGPKRGLRGPALFTLEVGHDTKGSLQGSGQLTPGQVNALREGDCYVLLSSEKAPDGNLWGWFFPEVHP